jgi:hypothetical protein
LDFPQLFAICSDPMLLMAIAGHRRWDILFRRMFGPEETIAWEALWARLPATLLVSRQHSVALVYFGDLHG